MQLSGQAVSGTCSGFLKKEKFKEGRWTDVFTGVSEQLAYVGVTEQGIWIWSWKCQGLFVWIFLAKGMSLLLL